MVPDIYTIISQSLPHMSKSQRKIAKYILSNAESVPFFTVSKLASMAGVSEATVVRFANFLDFKGYPPLQRALQESVKRKLSTVDRLKMSDQVYDVEEKAIYEMFDDDIQKIKVMSNNLDPDMFHRAVDLIIAAKRIFIISNRSAVSLGLFLEYYLDLIFENTEMIRNPHGISEKLFRLNKDDVVIGISFPRYTQSTIDAITFAKDRGSKIIAITDSLTSPLIPYADVQLTAPTEVPLFIDTFVAPLSLINALLVSVGRRKRKEIEKHLENLEDVWERFDVFYK